VSVGATGPSDPFAAPISLDTLLGGFATKQGFLGSGCSAGASGGHGPNTHDQCQSAQSLGQIVAGGQLMTDLIGINTLVGVDVRGSALCAAASAETPQVIVVVALGTLEEQTNPVINLPGRDGEGHP
jgi:hypothetical protein